MIHRTPEQQKEDLREMARIAEDTNGYKCNKCDGRGYDGFEITMQSYTPCVCVIKSVKKIETEKLTGTPICKN